MAARTPRRTTVTVPDGEHTVPDSPVKVAVEPTWEQRPLVPSGAATSHGQAPSISARPQSNRRLNALHPRYVAIEGPDAALRRHLAEALAHRWQARLLLHDSPHNPFAPTVGETIEDIADWPFQAQVFELLSRHGEQRHLHQPDLFSRGTVADYILDRALIHARVFLEGAERALLEKIHGLFAADTTQPDLVVYLHVGREGAARLKPERYGDMAGVGSDVLSALLDAYSGYFFDYDRAPLLVVNPGSVDLLADHEELNGVLEAIEQFRGARAVYHPATPVSDP
jgi:deoxyguanosine kinase